MVDLPITWFPNKRIVDIGCGLGRFTYGLLALGATVLATDQSHWGLQRAEALCAQYADRLTLKQVDLLEWDETAEFDLAFCFGVVHHTGNTYLAIHNAAKKVKKGGRLFLMIYGMPNTILDFEELNEGCA
jgi:2-polyprenyl-3-methyl-5-hydroxy-6-metoxy-1,4-benzoquinol methylase